MRPASSSGWGGEFVSLRRRAISVQVLLAVTIAIELVAVALVFVEIGLVNDALSARPVDLDALDANTDRATALGNVSLAMLVLTGIMWWVWQYRGQANLLAAGRRGLDHGPWGAVGWWLVPIANLWMPFKTVRELWKASEPVEDPSAWAGVSTGSVLGWWWALWIVSNLLASASGFATGSEDLETIRTADFTALAGLACSVFAACLAIGVVRQITRRQEELASARPVYVPSPSVPPPVPGGVAELPPPPAIAPTDTRPPTDRA